MLETEIQERIAKNNKQISELLQENEALLKQFNYCKMWMRRFSEKAFLCMDVNPNHT